jgi:hypothetical protein
MTARTLLTSTLLLAGLAAAPASAQYYYGYGPREDWGPRYAPGPYSYNAPPPVARGYDDDYPPRAPRPLSARAVIDRLEDMGYDDVGAPRFTGTLYIVVATAPGGLRQQVTVDAIRGIILNQVPMAGRPGQPRDYDEDTRPRRYGARPLDTDDLYREPETVAPRRAPPRREAARPDPIESSPVPPPSAGLPAPADPRLAPSAPQPEPPRAASRPPEGRKATREASTEPRKTAPTETGARPFGINPTTPPAAKAKPAEATKPDGSPVDAKKPVDGKKPVAEAQPRPSKSVRVIQGVTPLVNGESRSQLDSLPRPPEPAAPTGE